MGKLKPLLLLLCVTFFGTVQAMPDTSVHFTEKAVIKGSFSNFYVDNLNNIYLLTGNRQIKKINDHFDSAAVFDDVRRYGDIFSMDVSNSLKLVVYYKDFATILVLDRFLHIINTIDLRKNNIQQAKAVAASYDNNYWVFDEVENKLKKIDDNGNLLLETPDFRTIFNEDFLPDKLIDNIGLLYLFNKEKGCRVFDYYGAYKQKFPLNGWQDVQVIDGILYGFLGNSLSSYNPKTFADNTIDIGITSFKKAFKTSNNFYFLKEDGLHVLAAQ